MNISEILNIQKPNEYKIHLAKQNKGLRNPLIEFQKGEFEHWQSWQSKQNFSRPFILSLICCNDTEWLFAGIYKSLGAKIENDHIRYKTELTNKGSTLIGRLIINFKREFRQSYLKLENYVKDLQVLELRKCKSSIEKFPGYKNVSLPFDLLKVIIDNNEMSWKTALENVRGIYLITDTKIGKLYVGKASGESALWARWSEYIHTGHGGNKDLKKVVSQKGIEYAKNYFLFTLLEVTEFNTEDDINKRESYWKEVFKSRKFGYNNN